MVFGSAPRELSGDTKNPPPPLPPSPMQPGGPRSTTVAPPGAGPATAPTAGAAPGSQPAPGTTTPTPVPPTVAIPPPIRTLLDPATLSEIQRLERNGRAPTDPDALEKIADALRQRSQALKNQARTVRPAK
jgi:hypothetical protein